MVPLYPESLRTPFNLASRGIYSFRHRRVMAVFRMTDAGTLAESYARPAISSFGSAARSLSFQLFCGQMHLFL